MTEEERETEEFISLKNGEKDERSAEDYRKLMDGDDYRHNGVVNLNEDPDERENKLLDSGTIDLGLNK